MGIPPFGGNPMYSITKDRDNIVDFLVWLAEEIYEKLKWSHQHDRQCPLEKIKLKKKKKKKTIVRDN